MAPYRTLACGSFWCMERARSRMREGTSFVARERGASAENPPWPPTALLPGPRDVATDARVVAVGATRRSGIGIGDGGRAARRNRRADLWPLPGPDQPVGHTGYSLGDRMHRCLGGSDWAFSIRQLIPVGGVRLVRC